MHITGAVAFEIEVFYVRLLHAISCDYARARDPFKCQNRFAFFLQKLWFVTWLSG